MPKSGTITGKVINAKTQAALSKASVLLRETSLGTITNKDGTFTLKSVKPGKYTLIVSMVGFEKFTKNIIMEKTALS